jgi:Transposase DDE domain
MNQDKITNIFVEVDDFCQKFDKTIRDSKKLASNDPKKTRVRASRLSDSEIITILICFHLGAHRCFKHYYEQVIREHYSHLFPGLLSYHRFLEVQKKVAVPYMLFLKECRLGKCTSVSFIDSTTIKVCRNQRITWHKTFKGIAERGKSSMGWFFGFKLHLIINDKGEILSFYLSKGNKDDRNIKIVQSLTRDIFGKLFGDKGYLSQALFDTLFQDGIQLFTKLKKNMKNHLMTLKDKILLRKRAIIETVNDELKNLCQLEHSRHRSVNGFLINIISTLVAYSYFPKKPSLNIHPEEKSNQLAIWA